MGATTDTGLESLSEDSVLRQAATHAPRWRRGPADQGVPHQLAVQEKPMLGTILGLLIIGLIAGFIARAVVAGRQSMGILHTILLGIAGSFVGGFLGRIFFSSGDSLVQPASWIGSIIGAVIVLMLYLLIKGRARTDPAGG